MAQVATVVFALGILGLFWLDRDPSSRTSRALWIPVVWMSIAGSQNVSQWLQGVPPSQDGNLLDQSITVALIACGIRVLVRRGSKVSTLLSANRPTVLYFLYCATSILWSEYPAATFTRWVKAFGDLLMVLIVLTDPAPTDAVERALSWVSFLLLPLAVLFIKYYPERSRYYDVWTGMQYYSGVAADKNMMGMTCLAFTLVSVWRIIEAFWPYFPLNFSNQTASKAGFRPLMPIAVKLSTWRGIINNWRNAQKPLDFTPYKQATNRSWAFHLAESRVWNGERNRKTRLLIAHGIVLYMGFWVFSRIDSMTSLSCFLIAISLIAVIRLSLITRRPWVIHIVVVLVLLFTLSVLFFGLGGSILGSMGRNSTLTGRTELWNALSSMNPSPILGTGFEAFWRGPRVEHIARAVGGGNEAHNGYFEVFLNLGWTGVTLLAFIIAVGYRNVYRAIRLEPEAGRLWLAYFVAGIVYSITEAGFRLFTPVWITFLLAIIGSSATFTNAQYTEQQIFSIRWGATPAKNTRVAALRRSSRF
jgi:hypothetical protein